MLSACFRRLVPALLAACTPFLSSQGTPSAVALPLPSSVATPSRIPRAVDAGWQRGLNAGVTFTGVHDSATGWYSVATPAVSFNFGRYTADVSLPIYPYRTLSLDAIPAAGSRLVFNGGDLGDMLLEGHATFNSGKFWSTSTVSMTLPTGSRADGLGTGRVAFSFDDRVERSFGRTAVVVDAGGGDSSGLVNRLVTEDDTGLGPSAQFQAGLLTWLPSGVSIQSVAYEQLPIGDQKTYSTVRGFGFPGTTVVTGRKVSEDNGFTTTFNVPLTAHFALIGSYNRSLRLHLDTVSTGVSYAWKGFPVHRRESLIDQAIHEAESGHPLAVPQHQ